MAEMSLMCFRAARVMATCAMVALCGCAGASEQGVSVDGYRFAVPAQYLVQGSIFFLPKEQNDGLRFVLDPDATLPAQHMVSIGPLSESCGSLRGGTMASTQLADSCAAAKGAVEWPVLGATQGLQRLYESGSTTEWHYRETQPGPAGQPKVVATCTAMADRDGLCISDGAYKHLVYSLHFRESELKDLGALHTQVRALLRAWER